MEVDAQEEGQPFAKVDGVMPQSPASVAVRILCSPPVGEKGREDANGHVCVQGLQRDDLLLSFGPLR